MNFVEIFKLLTGNASFPWQAELFERFVEQGKRPPNVCNIPTGLGKTAVIAVWLIARALHPDRVPRRLVYVVNRRTVVDQTTTEVEKLCENLGKPELAQLKELLGGVPEISTLRGQMADNRRWSADPSRPAIICGTVDMIGSRLLFSGYGVGFRSRPLQAAFLGQDTLVVHDEAHLEPAFQQLLEEITAEQLAERKPDVALPWPPLRVMQLSATSRGVENVHRLGPDDRKAPEVIRRLGSKKSIKVHEVDEKKELVKTVLGLAEQHAQSDKAVIIFLRTVEDVDKVTEKLPKDQTLPLTGTMRGYERDQLVSKPVFQRFLPLADRRGEARDGAVFLVCTSAGEVGVNISADHLICDLSTLDSMVQRFGRVNRFGTCDDSHIDIVAPSNFDKTDDFASRREHTLQLIRELKEDGSPGRISRLFAEREVDLEQAFAKPPETLPVSDFLFDAWALTSIRNDMPGRPPVEPYLHGLSENDPPETVFAWRAEVEKLTPELMATNLVTPEQLLDLYPLKPLELLKLPTEGKGKAYDQLQKIANRHDKHATLPVWIVDANGCVTIHDLSEFADKKKAPEIAWRTVLLPPVAGGLTDDGRLDGDCLTASDVADLWGEVPKAAMATPSVSQQARPQRLRLLGSNPEFNAVASKMRLLRQFDLSPTEEDSAASVTSPVADAVDQQTEDELDDPVGKYRWYWFAAKKNADDDRSKSSNWAISLESHTGDVEREADALACSILSSAPDLAQALRIAARVHDLGKRRTSWQLSIGNASQELFYAKSGKLRGGGMLKPTELTPYRHEFGSLVDLEQDPEFRQASPDVQELVRHLVAAHHGYARPHFPIEAFDPEMRQAEAGQMAGEVTRRFARLQRKYGRWGLAYLESLLRAADWRASAEPSEGVSQ